MITEDMINRAYSVLANRQAASVEAALALTDARSNLERAEADCVQRGTIVGHNETERKSARNIVLGAEIGACARANSNWERARQDRDLAQLEVDRLDMVLRLLELECTRLSWKQE